MTLEEIYNCDDLFGEVLNRIKDGMSITFTDNNVSPRNHFLILGRHHKSCTCTFKWRDCLWVFFDNDSPMELADCPDDFFESILLNID